MKFKTVKYIRKEQKNKGKKLRNKYWHVARWEEHMVSGRVAEPENLKTVLVPTFYLNTVPVPVPAPVPGHMHAYIYTYTVRYV